LKQGEAGGDEKVKTGSRLLIDTEHKKQRLRCHADWRIKNKRLGVCTTLVK
jgi:hypothetical protein